MRQTDMQKLSLVLGSVLVFIGLTIGFLVGMANLSTWLMILVLGIVLILRSFIFEGDQFDEREKMINYKSYKMTFIVTIVLGMLFYSLYFFKFLHLAGEDAFVIYLACIVLIQGIFSFIYARQI